MRISWIIADDFVSPHVTPEQLKDVGPVWGSWRTWRAWNTDNVLCNEYADAEGLVKRKFHETCNFYVPEKHYAQLNRPKVNLYGGDFPGALDHPEEIVSMHLVAESSDLVLLLGYDLTEKTFDDKMATHKRLNYVNAFRATLNTYPETQWVLIDHPGDLDKSLTKITNLTCDKFESVLNLLS